MVKITFALQQPKMKTKKTNLIVPQRDRDEGNFFSIFLSKNPEIYLRKIYYNNIRVGENINAIKNYSKNEVWRMGSH